MKFTGLFKLTLGFVALALAFVGLVLPVLPTTPFVLLAIGCFSSMPVLRNKVLRIHCFREYYESYTAGKGICRKTVAISLIYLWGMLTLSIILVSKLSITLLLLAVGSVVTVHILWIAKGRTTKNKLSGRDTDAEKTNCPETD